MSNRIYKGTLLNGDGTMKEYLVMAASQGQARTHIAMKVVSVRPATPQDVAECMGAGVKVEKYVEAKPAAPTQKDIEGNTP